MYKPILVMTRRSTFTGDQHGKRGGGDTGREGHGGKRHGGGTRGERHRERDTGGGTRGQRHGGGREAARERDIR